MELGESNEGEILHSEILTSPWAELMTKTFGIDPEICLCGARMVVQKCITDAGGIAAMMVKLGLSGTPPPLGRVKGPSGELSYLFDGE